MISSGRFESRLHRVLSRKQEIIRGISKRGEMPKTGLEPLLSSDFNVRELENRMTD